MAKTILVDPDLCTGCKTCEISCAVNRVSNSKTLKEAINEKPKPLPRIYVHKISSQSIPLQCLQCNDYPCLKACPSGAIYREEEHGKIILNQDRCVGCWMCVMVCPFGVINVYLEAKKADKCDQCAFMEYPVCVDSCPTGSLQWVETEDKSEEVMIKKRNRNINNYIEREAGSH